MIELILAKIWPYLAIVAGLLAGLFAARQSGKASERTKIEAKQAQSTIEGMKNAREARNEIESLDDAAVRDRARQRLRDRGR